MALKFQVTFRKAGFLDPFNDFARREVTVEVRKDPLTGDLCRILVFRRKGLGEIDHSEYLEKDQPAQCPFCPGNLEKFAARFLPEQAPEGHLTHNQAVCFPNAFPYESLNAVVVMGPDHYLRPSEFTPDLLGDAIWLARKAFVTLGGEMGYGSVNWNYMMPAGAGLVHPHFQIAGGKSPTKAQAAIRSRARAYTRANSGASIAADYLAAEKADGSRYVGRVGAWHFMAAFAPRGLYDFIGLAPDLQSLLTIRQPGVRDLARGLSRLLNYFEDQGVAAHNFSLHTGLREDAGLPLMVRLISRVDIPPKGVDEINYFHKLHDESLTFVPPEEAAQGAAAGWKGKYADNS